MASTSQPTTAHRDEEEEATSPEEAAGSGSGSGSGNGNGSGSGSASASGSASGSASASGSGSQLVMPEDGYEWKKYGQKFIINIQKIRSYFRCRDKRCGAKKKVEWHPHDPSLRVVYDGAHQHGSPPSSTGGQGGGGAANRYELSAQYFGGPRTQ